MNVSQRLEAWRLAKGLSQRQAAELAGMSQPAWSSMESGDFVRATVDTATRIEIATGGEIKVGDWSTVAPPDESGEHSAIKPSRAAGG